VLFNGTPASYQLINATTLVAAVPVGATTGPVAITTSTGTGTSAASFTVSATTAPTPAGDTSKPDVSFTVPAAGATLAPNTQVLLTVIANDNVAVQGLTFTNGATGALIGAGAKNGSTYTFPYTTGAAGQLSLVATATDAAGNSQSATVNVTVQAATAPNQKPSVSFSPSTNTAPTVGVQKDYLALATDPDGLVQLTQLVQVTSLVDLTVLAVLASDATSPYSLSWTPVASGTLYLAARAVDDKGAEAFSSVVAVTVQAAASGGGQSLLTQLGLSLDTTRMASLYPAAAASDYSYFFTALPLPGAVVITPPAGAIKLSSAPGVIGDADISEGSSNYGTECTAAIQQFLDSGAASATASQPFLVDWDLPVSLSAALRLRSYTSLYTRLNCGAILRPQSNCSLLETYNWYNPAGRDTNIGIYGPGTWNHNSFSGNVVPAQDSGFNQIHSSPTTGWTTAIRVGHCDNFTWDGPMILRQRTFALHACNTTGLVLKNGVINAGTPGAPINTDGLHINFDATNCIIDNWQINSHDDKVSIAVNDAMDTQNQGGPSTYYLKFTQNRAPVIDGVTVTSIEFTGGVFGLRVYSGMDQLRNVSFKGIYGSTKGYWLIMDNYWQSSSYDRRGPGFVSNVSFEDVYVQSVNSGVGYINECGANINCNAQNITFRNINRTGFSQSNFPSLLISGAGTVVSSLTWDGYEGHDLDSNSFQNSHIVIKDAKVTGLTVSNAKVSRLGGATGNALVGLVSGSLDGLLLNNVQVDGLANVVKHSGGTLGQVTATNVYHVNAGSGNGSFYSTVTPGPKITATNCTTQLLLQGTSTN
jgi:hypothetical protein